MVAAFDIRALGSASHIGREVTFEEAFMDTFDQAVTPSATPEPFDSWAEWFGVEVWNVGTEGDIMMGLLAMCPFFQEPSLRAEVRYDINAHMFGSEESYLNALNG